MEFAWGACAQRGLPRTHRLADARSSSLRSRHANGQSLPGRDTGVRISRQSIYLTRKTVLQNMKSWRHLFDHSCEGEFPEMANNQSAWDDQAHEREVMVNLLKAR